MKSLLFSSRFGPLFLTQALGAFNDNLYKTALIVLITYDLAFAGFLPPALMVTAAGGLFILPFFLFSAYAWQLGDRCDKARMIRATKWAEVAIMVLALPGFLFASADYLMVILFLMGSQSAFFGPLKYAILPQQLTRAELPAGNAWIEAATFLAILGGTVFANLMIAERGGSTTLLAVIVIGLALLGAGTARAIPPAPPDPTQQPLTGRLPWVLVTGTAALIATLRHEGRAFRYILAISWFWAIGATMLTQLPTYGKNILGGDETVLTLLLCSFSIGIAIGSLLCGRIMGGNLSLKPVLIGAAGMGGALFDLFWASPVIDTTIDSAGVLDSLAHLRVLGDLTLLSVFGGFYAVPLYAILQQESPPDKRAQAIACTNVMNALFMVLAAVIALVLQGIGFQTPDLFGLLALGCLPALVQAWRLERAVRGEKG